MADGPEAALAVLDGVRDDPRLARFHLLGAVRGDVLLRLGRTRRRPPSWSVRPSWPRPATNGSC